MFTLEVKKENKTKEKVNFTSRADAQEKIDILYMKRGIDVKEWRRLTTILSEPAIEG